MGRTHPSAASASGAALYADVAAYSALGNHWTGTAVDDATRNWLGERLAALGAEVDEVGYEFDQYVVGGCEIGCDAQLVPSVPLFYEGAADLDTENVFVADVVNVGFGLADPPGLADIVESAVACGAEVAVVPTAGSTGDVVAVNREPREGSGLPVVLAPGSAAAMLQAGRPRARLQAHRSRGRTANMIGSWSGGSRSPVLLVTPLTGWFGCAGERGTGIAIALALAARLSVDRAVTLVGTTGHETGFLGAQQIQPSEVPDDALVIHIGASAAASGESRDVLSAQRWLLASGCSGRQQAVETAAAQARLQFAGDPDVWLGEGRWLRGLGATTLSIAGHFPRFHTPGDVPADSTSPELLQRVFLALDRLVREILS